MEFIVVLILPLLVLVVLAIVGCAILEVAFAGPQPPGRESLAAKLRWQPPTVRGDELFAWARDTATAVTASWLTGPRGRDTARQVVTEIYAGMTRANVRSPNASVRRVRGCPSCRHQRIGVTPPEALAIVDSLHKCRSRSEVQRIRDRAARNSAAIEAVGHKQYEQARVVCPLLLGDGCCAVFDARPVHCRGWCLVKGGECGSNVLAKSHATAVDASAHTVGRGAEAGLSRGLESAGLDGTVYELNSALVVALDTPSAADRWAHGASDFEHCERCDSSAGGDFGLVR